MSKGEYVWYKGKKCEIVYDYGNGYYEIRVDLNVELVHESKIQILDEPESPPST
ncbi:hypothetical protein PP175_28715 (plasmid) [Aneurinibacillus sp. Ricciae_BoGa-3]|uniref:hypothetical protein n=1 Tax=Aneurinibacillus sp. Ricciae_BoGa-3 TaxID=3022697 RepID=UPI002340F111|nr:hypothetical protein [Aneurinibacillus sp. Ricciae_BoGa-3]WCK57173.1 hypothetical protein PP175_28715 [Aneurinibacillus sp. Ricciae_BoGa-3]